MSKKVYNRTDGDILDAAALEALKKVGTMQRQEIFHAVAQRVALKPDDCTLNKSNNQLQWQMRVGLNLSMEKIAEYVENPTHGYWCLTAKGLAYMQTPEYQEKLRKLLQA